MTIDILDYDGFSIRKIQRRYFINLVQEKNNVTTYQDIFRTIRDTNSRIMDSSRLGYESLCISFD